jgi:hypothetical protein
VSGAMSEEADKTCKTGLGQPQQWSEQGADAVFSIIIIAAFPPPSLAGKRYTNFF